MKNSVKKKIDLKWPINIGFIFILALISTFTYLKYQDINKLAENDKRSAFDHSEIIDSFNKIKVYYANDLLRNVEGYEDGIIKGVTNEYKENNKYNYENHTYEEYTNQEEYLEKMEKDVIENELNNILNTKNYINGFYPDMHTFVTRTDDEKIFFRNKDNIEILDESLIKSTYEFYIDFEFDANGVLKINKILGADKNSYEYSLNGKNIPKSEVEIKEIKNIRYIFAYPKNIINAGEVERIKSYYYEDNVNMFLLIYLGIIAVAFIMLALIIPFRYSKNIIGVRVINKIYIEIMALITIISLGTIPLYSYFVQDTLQYHQAKGFLKKILFIKNPQPIIDFVHIVYIMLFAYIIFAMVVYIKNIIKIGFVNSIKEKSIVFKIGKKIYNLLKRVKNYIVIKLRVLSEIDFADENKKRFALILALNFLILVIISCAWVFAFIPLAIYTITLFIFITKKYKQYKDNYNKLTKAIDEIGKSNLNIAIEEDIKPFNELKDKLCNLDKDFSEAVKSEIKSNNMKTELISNVSHDLKTPLTSIVSYVDLLKNEDLSEETRRQYLDILDRKSLRLTELIENLFEVSRASSGNIELKYDYIDVVELLKQSILEFEDRFKEKNLDLRISFSEDKIVLRLDGQRMFRVFENLLANISKYSMNNSRVYINVDEQDDKVRIILKNMAEHELNFKSDEIVERFVRGDKSRHTDGSGLGLAIAKSFIEAQNGHLNIEVDGDLFKTIISFDKLK